VRIFTPRQELPFAGHPSVGSAHAALVAGLALPADGRLVQQCAAGLLPVRVEGSDSTQRIFVRAPRARVVPIEADAALWLGVLDGLPLGALPASLLDNGPRWWLVELADEATVRTMVPDAAAISRLTQATGAVGLAVFAHCDSTQYQLVVRAFCPADGIPEDPVTGSANASIGAWIAQNGALRSRKYTASQGRELGRDGLVGVEVDDEGEVWIGGQTQEIVHGTLDW
jgi:PhzF family phenazine biosynthesis protein